MTERRIAVVGEAWGENEESVEHPFVGASGVELLRALDGVGILTLSREDRQNISDFWKFRKPYFTMLVWQAHPEILVTNVFNLRPRPTNDIKNLCGPKAEGIPGSSPITRGKFINRAYAPELERLERELTTFDPTTIIALGGTAAWALGLGSGIKKVRGSPAVSHLGLKVLPTYHPAAILRQYNLYPIFIRDLEKALAESAFPEVRRPQRFIHVEPTYDDLLSFEREWIEPTDALSIDIETAGNQITCIGFATSVDRALVVPIVDDTKANHCYWPDGEVEIQVWSWIRRICNLEKSVVVGQNFNYDLKFLLMSYGITCRFASDDTMLQHHAMQPEMEKSLGFLASIYTNEMSWKFMRPKHTVKKED